MYFSKLVNFVDPGSEKTGKTSKLIPEIELNLEKGEYYFHRQC